MSDVVITLAVGLGQILGAVLAVGVCFLIRAWFGFWSR